jgi:hypothetical protein
MPHAVPPQLIRRRAEFLIDNLQGFLDFGESRIEQALEEEREEIKSIDQALVDTYGEDIPTDADVEALQERWGCDDPDAPWQPYSPLHSVFPRYLRYSFVQLTALVFESELLVLCLSIAENLGVPPPESGGKASAAKKARTFLTSHLDAASIDAIAWDGLQDMLKIRNCIAHVGGRVDLSTDRVHIETLIAREIGLRVNEHERPGVRLLSIERQYCERIVEEVGSLFSSICDAVGY